VDVNVVDVEAFAEPLDHNLLFFAVLPYMTAGTEALPIRTVWWVIQRITIDVVHVTAWLAANNTAPGR
jgi:hypothetical protein